MIAQVDRDGDGKISIDGMSRSFFLLRKFEKCQTLSMNTCNILFHFILEFTILMEREC